MCGIFGLVSSSGNLFASRKRALKLLRSFYVLSESRGKEASGAALLIRNRIDVVKAPVRGRHFLDLPQAAMIAEAFAEAIVTRQPFAFMGHTRMVTNGGGHIHGNNQPVLRDGLVAIHNGIIVNDKDLWLENPHDVRALEVDTEAMLMLLSKHLKAGVSLAEGVSQAMASLQGANSLAVMSTMHDGIVLTTSNGSMFFVKDVMSGVVAFASERSILEKLVTRSLYCFASLQPSMIQQLLPGSSVSIPLISSLGRQAGIETMDIEVLPSEVSRSITDHPTTNALSSSIGTNTSRLKEIETLTEIDWASIKALRRCTRCILPETFPFIKFDSNGVCNFCNAHRPRTLNGEASFREFLSGVKRSDGRPEVLFPISGGRDSCYGLHKLVKDFGVKPVAYTYDWGMVTDLARRNISRLCGALGIEHVLISADIAKKREYIRKNVAAWLKSPHLGTIPLFMAGDKQFFYYANMLKDEMGLGGTVFSMNPLERTDFKMGFCGIDESYHKEKHYDPKFLHKLRLGAFYAAQFIKNPAYINKSLMDSAFAYFSYYLIPKDYISMFDYLPWIEQEVESVLKNQYDWEMSPDTNSTWRIGDGTAAFYNYIYLKVVGFSENDTFRSNQIREGLMDRDAAMERIHEDNHPRAQSIAWYFDMIGLDALDAIKIINRIKH